MTDVDDIELKLKKYSINNTSLLKFKVTKLKFRIDKFIPID